jgi:hypothetical protein
MRLSFEGELIHWRGPAPFYFIQVNAAISEEIHDVAPLITYGWGVIPVEAEVGRTTWKTSLFPRDGRYLVPIKNVVRQAETLELGQQVAVALTLELNHEQF